MTVTRDVVYDLLPLYFAGQVSDDTKRLVADFFKADPEFGRMAERFASLVKDERDERRSSDLDRGVLTLRRTRRFLRYRNQLIGAAVPCSLMPFSFGFGGGDRTWFMLRDNPQAAAVFALVGLGCWIGAYLMGHRSRHTGL
jgi:hypothetical protein